MSISYSTLLGRPRLNDAIVTHNWGNDIVTKTIMVTKHMGTKVKIPKVLCYNYQNGITDEEEDIIFVIKLKLFSICTISLPNTFQFIRTSKSNHKNIKAKNGNTKLSST